MRPKSNGHFSIRTEEYILMCRKLYLTSKLEEGDASVDVQECMENMKED